MPAASPGIPTLPRKHRAPACPTGEPAAAWRRTVDLPIPGSPPIRVAEEGTTPPPMTRSNSAIPHRALRALSETSAREPVSTRESPPRRRGTSSPPPPPPRRWIPTARTRGTCQATSERRTRRRCRHTRFYLRHCFITSQATSSKDPLPARTILRTSSYSGSDGRSVRQLRFLDTDSRNASPPSPIFSRASAGRRRGTGDRWRWTGKRRPRRRSRAALPDKIRSTHPGRFFFIVAGSTATSRAPAENALSISSSNRCGLMSSMFASTSSTRSRTGTGHRLLPPPGGYWPFRGSPGGPIRPHAPDHHLGRPLERTSKARRIAAPVGVTNSPSPSPSRHGAPVSSASVAGPGTGIVPWDDHALPDPPGRAEQ